MESRARRLRILYSSNAMWASSGYGVQGKSLLPRLRAMEQVDDIAMFAWYGLQGGVHHVDGFTVYPAGADPYGNDIIGAHAKEFVANVVISLIDVWVMHETAQKVAPALWLAWLPIDHDPVPQRVLESLQGCHLPITYSKWGHRLLEQAGVKNHYIPHGVETGTYKVLEDREAVANFKRQLCNGDNGHLTVMVAANKGYPDRKAFQVQLRAWADFARDKPEARLYMHTEPTGMYGGIDFPVLLQDLRIADRVVFPERYRYFLGYPPEYLALVYNAADIYLGAAMSEGFGIPLVEAQACGCPVVTTDFSAMPELVRWGVAVKPADKFWTPMNSWQAWPDVRGITDALNGLYEQWHNMGRQWHIVQRQLYSALTHAEYGWDTIVEMQWKPLLARLVGEAPPLPKEPDMVRVERVTHHSSEVTA